MERFKKAIAIVNPYSANGSTGRQWPRTESLLREVLGTFDSVFTTAPGIASFLALEASRSGYDLIVGVGGDGTANEIVNGLFADGAPGKIPVLAFIPGGTSGDFRKTLGIPRAVEEAVARLAGGNQRKIDVGKMTIINPDGAEIKRYFLNIASFGIGGLVDKNVNSSTKIFGDRVSFFIATVKAFMTFPNQRVRISFDGNPTEEIVINNVAIANGRFFGGGMMIAPQAELDDGKFDVVALGDISLWDIIVIGTKLYRGTHMTHPKVRRIKASTICAEPVDSCEQVLIDNDGETPGRLPATFEILPSALTVIS